MMKPATQIASSAHVPSSARRHGCGLRNVPPAFQAAFWGCIVISLAVVVRRLIAFASPPRPLPPQLAFLDATFASHTALTLAHILPAAVFVVLAPIVLLGMPGRAAWAERALYPLGAIVGVTGLAMSTFAIGGWIERSAVLFFDSWFLISLLSASWSRRRARREDERRRLLRAIVVLLGIATTRPVMGVFFATSMMTHLTPRQFFGIAFWIGFSINALAIELWLRTGHRAQIRAEALPAGQ